MDCNDSVKTLQAMQATETMFQTALQAFVKQTLEKQKLEDMITKLSEKLDGFDKKLDELITDVSEIRTEVVEIKETVDGTF
jgi:phage shock protein A